MHKLSEIAQKRLDCTKKVDITNKIDFEFGPLIQNLKITKEFWEMKERPTKLKIKINLDKKISKNMELLDISIEKIILLREKAQGIGDISLYYFPGYKSFQ
ncbi:MAG: hypothetical protein KKF44_05445 [Nanoarchaeota archaeon]|nr:hypothetical protein [Nanoarchaeota archaeon]